MTLSAKMGRRSVPSGTGIEGLEEGPLNRRAMECIVRRAFLKQYTAEVKSALTVRADSETHGVPAREPCPEMRGSRARATQIVSSASDFRKCTHPLQHDVARPLRIPRLLPLPQRLEHERPKVWIPSPTEHLPSLVQHLRHKLHKLPHRAPKLTNDQPPNALMRPLDMYPPLHAHELRDRLRAHGAHARRAEVVRRLRGRGDVHPEDERADAVERAPAGGSVERGAEAGAEVEEGERGEEVELRGGGGEGEWEGVAVRGAES